MERADGLRAYRTQKVVFGIAAGVVLSESFEEHRTEAKEAIQQYLPKALLTSPYPR